MRYLLLYLIFSVSFFSSFSQNAGIGVGTINPHPSAQLDVSAINKGLLPPRLTYAQRNAIVNPAAGLIIWCSDCLPEGEVQVFNGTRWTNMTGGAAAVNFPTVTIGSQTWSSRNVDVVRYRNEDPIPQVTDPAQWANLTTGAWCWYNNDSTTYAATYGRLYNWYAVADSRGLCPMGWHVPSDVEWSILVNQLGGSSIAGGVLKSTAGWISPNTGATNSSGFSALPGGYRNASNGLFGLIGRDGNWWTTSEIIYTNAWYRYAIYNSSSLNTNDANKKHGFSVRCLKD